MLMNYATINHTQTLFSTNNMQPEWFIYIDAASLFHLLSFDLCYSISCATNFLSYLIQNYTLHVNSIIENMSQL